MAHLRTFVSFCRNKKRKDAEIPRKHRIFAYNTMLIRFKVGNYLSFKEETTFSLVSESLREKSVTNTFDIPIGDLNILKSIALFGPNGSGKSNLLKAIEFVVSFIQNSQKEMQAEEEISIMPFKLSTQTEGKPSFFEIEILVHDFIYRYGFTATRELVQSEWLYYSKKFKEYPLFRREKNKFIVDPKFPEGHDIEGKTRANALFLSAVAQWNGRIATSIIETLKKFSFFNDILDFRDSSYTTELYSDPAYKNAIFEFLKSADLGITDIKIEQSEISNELFQMLSPQVKKQIHLKKFLEIKSVKTAHAKFDDQNNQVEDVYLDLMKEESLGTQKIYSLAGPIVDALRNGKVLIIDEFTARLHPLLCQFIIKKFNSTDYNASNAQLIFASHNFGLMERTLFRSDQIILTEKSKQNATILTSFYHHKIRHDASFRGKYFSGSYGAKPNIPDDKQGDQLGLFES